MPLTKLPPRTPDGRYLVVRGRLWRAANPHLDPIERQQLVDRLMKARRAVRSQAADAGALKRTRDEIDAVKRALGERGPVWWTDGAPDLNRRMARNTTYAAWYASLPDPGSARGCI